VWGQAEQVVQPVLGLLEPEALFVYPALLVAAKHYDSLLRTYASHR
jgi:hypothetical protein